jgi:DeoR/GlpR family transcriptional regulator of sugar metabolism
MNHRQQILMDELNRCGHVSVVGLAEKLKVTEMTIRRDLQMLEQQRLLTRVHGGAIPSSKLPLGTDILTIPANVNQVAIAKAAVAALPPNATVMLNVGTTVLQVAREMVSQRLALNVVTNSLPVAIILYQSECHVLLTGGSLRRQSLDLVGPVTEKNIDEYHVDILIAGCDGAIAGEGFFTSDVNLAAMEQKSVRIAAEVMIVTESHKFHKRSMAKFADISEVSTIITDTKLPSVDAELIRQHGINLLTAN